MVTKLQHLKTNPIREFRESEGKKIDEIAEEAGINSQCWFLSECGVYRSCPPAIITHYLNRGYDATDFPRRYREYVSTRREGFAGRHRIDVDTFWLPSSSNKQSPIISFRELLRLSRMGLAKELCVQPAILYKLEKGRSTYLPLQLREALQEAGFSASLIEELDERVREYYDYVKSHRS